MSAQLEGLESRPSNDSTEVWTGADVVCEGRWVRLAPLSMEWLEPLRRAVGPHPADVFQWFSQPVLTHAEMAGFIEEALERRRRGEALPFVTIERASGIAVGATRFGNLDRTNRRVEIGWTWLGPPWQRSALNTEAKLLMLGHAFETWACVRVELRTDRLNTRSRAAISRLGAQEEGILRRHQICRSGRIRDTVVYAILDREWPTVKARLSARLEQGA